MAMRGRGDFDEVAIFVNGNRVGSGKFEAAKMRLISSDLKETDEVFVLKEGDEAIGQFRINPRLSKWYRQSCSLILEQV